MIKDRLSSYVCVHTNNNYSGINAPCTRPGPIWGWGPGRVGGQSRAFLFSAFFMGVEWQFYSRNLQYIAVLSFCCWTVDDAWRCLQPQTLPCSAIKTLLLFMFVKYNSHFTSLSAYCSIRGLYLLKTRVFKKNSDILSLSPTVLLVVRIKWPFYWGLQALLYDAIP